MERRLRIRVWIEWTSDALFWADDAWTREALGDRDNWHVSARKLPFSKETRARIEELDRWYQGRLNWADPAAPLTWQQEECDRFNVAFLGLFSTLQAELGEQYELINGQEPAVEDPNLQEYLKDPEGFRRRQCDMEPQSPPAKRRFRRIASLPWRGRLS
jgi:hypothetical protein